MSWIGAALAIASKTLDIILGWQRKSERGEQREAGRNEQKVADHENDRKQAAEARKAREDADRASDAELDDGLRKYARKPGK